MPKLIRRLWERFGSFILFCLVGCANTLIHLVVYKGLMSLLDMPYLAASCIGYACGTVNGYLLSGRFVFKKKYEAQNLVKFICVNILGILLNLLLMKLWVEGVGLPKLIAQLPTLVITTLTNFFVNRLWTFKGGKNRNEKKAS